MKLHPRVTRAGVELVKRFEGLRRRAARLPDGGWTVGYGHTRSAREGAEVTPDDAEALLYYDLSEVASKIEAWTFTPLNQNQFEALTALAFNIGLDNFKGSTVLKRVNEGQHLQAAAAFELWRKSDFNGEHLVVDALVRRRAAEKAHFLTPPEGFRPSPTPVLKPSFDYSVIEAAAHSQAALNAAIIDAPMTGEDARAFVETPPHDAAKPMDAADALTARMDQLFPEPEAETPAPLILHPTEPESEPEPIAPPAANDARALAFPPAPVTPTAPTSNEFRGFEPPPRRADLPMDEVIQTEPLREAAPFAAPEPAAETPSGFNLFNQPLAPPAAAAEAVRPVRLNEDAYAAEDATPAADGLMTTVGKGMAHNRFALFAVIGLIGVTLFSAAVFAMAFGKASSATPATLLMGLVGIALMTPAAIHLLVKWLNGAHGPMELTAL
jgi:lysozyme